MGFSFGSGNVAKLIRTPLYLAGRCATVVIPRSRDEWVFASAVGVADGALALWRLASREQRPITWLTQSDTDAAAAAALGIHHVPAASLAGFWRTARARVVVVTHGQGDANRYGVPGAFLVQLWHGIPLKRIGLDSAETTRTGVLPDRPAVRRLLAFAYRRTQRAIRLMPAASEAVRARLESAFALPPGRVRVTGEPRVDVLSAGTSTARRASARALVEQTVGTLPGHGTRIVLYAPTWRDGDADPGIPSIGEWAAIGALLDAHDAVLLVRPHPLGAGPYAPPPAMAERVRMLGSALLADVTPALPALDVLITDYSSLGYDVGLCGIPVIWFAPDEHAYGERRGFYGAYRDVAREPRSSWAEAARELDALLGDEAARAAASDRSRALSAEVHAFRDGGNTERVYRAILAGLSR